MGASRLVARLTDADQWKCFPGCHATAQAAAQHLSHTLLLTDALVPCLHMCMGHLSQQYVSPLML